MEEDTPFGNDPWGARFNPRPVEYLCTLPAALGAVTRLRNVNGRVIAETASGIPMIVPQKAALI